MAWFHNLKIRTKMIASFGVVIALVAGLSIFAVFQVININAVNSYVIDTPMSGQVALLNFRAAMRELRFITVSESTYATVPDKARSQSNRAAADSAYNDGIKYLNEYEAIIKNDSTLEPADADNTVKKIGEAKELLTQYRTEVSEPIIEAALAGDHGRTLTYFEAGTSINTSLRAINNELITTAAATAGNVQVSAQAMELRTLIILSIVAIAVVVISLVMALLISSWVSKPIARLVDVAKHVASGNLNVNIDTSSKDETGILAAGFSQVVNNIRGLIGSTSDMYRKHEEEGDIDARIDETAFEGAYREMAAGVNQMVTSYINLMQEIFGVLTAFGNGDFTQDLTRQIGKKEEANIQINNLRDRVNAISNEIRTLADACIAGKLSARGDTGRFQGTWQQLIVQLNALVDAVVMPIHESIDVMVEMSKGDLSANMTGNYKGDFLTIKNSLNTTANDISSYIEEIDKNLSQVAKGDLRGGITREYAGDFTSIKNAINEILASLGKTTEDIEVSSEQVLIGAKQISDSSMSLAEGATEQASTVQQLTANIDMINTQTHTNAEYAKEATELSLTTANNALKCNDEMKKMLESMEQIKESSNDISSIIKVIQDIAFQTNLLALNASVEAARAGEHGRGFAVVAEEVRTLAGHSKKAADETTNLIANSVTNVDEGMTIANTTAKSLDAIVSNAGEVSKIISNIADASAAQSEAVNQISIGINHISQVVQNNSSTSEESAAAAEQLNSQAEVLHQMVNFFKTK